jgi:HAE1 family hydrophobic/amphiphilic exporter-1
MLENIVRHTEMGEGVFPAALGGSEEVVFTILSMTLSLTAVFIPVLFMGGLIGRLLHEFAVTIAVAILVSGFVSVSLTPMLCSRFLKSSREAHHGRLYRWSERVFEGGLNAYSRSLRACLNRRVLTFAVSIVLLAASVRLFMIIPKGFLPSEDTGRINVQVEAMQGIGYPEMVRHQQQVAAIVADDPNVSGFTSSIGGMTGANAGRVNIDLKPRAERALSADQVIEELRPKLARVAGVRVYLTNPPPINIGGMRTRSLYQFTLQDTDTAELYRTAPVLEEKIRQLPGLEDVSSDLQIKSPQVQVDLDRDRIAALGLSVDTVENTLYNAYGTRQISTIYAPNNQYQVILGVMPAYQLDPNALSLLYVRASNGPLVPLNTVARVTTGVGPLTVNHVGQLPSVTISFNLKPGVSLGDAVAAVQAAASDLPATIATTFQGAAQAFQDSMQGLGLVLLLAIVVIYIVLGILYESFIHPLTILSGLPSAGLGALATLILFRVDLNLYAFVGVIMLVGLVMKNGIMMVDFAIEAQRAQDLSPVEAIYQACRVRFRPIMMTTMAALVGTAPIALGWGAGAESRRPLGLAVVGGLLVSQTLTLYLTPVYYVYLERLRLRFSKRAAAAQTYEAAPGTLHS